MKQKEALYNFATGVNSNYFVFWRNKYCLYGNLTTISFYLINKFTDSNMGITKKFGFAFKINEMADILKALGNPARLKIIQFLMNTPASNCGDIQIVLPLAQSTVSKHLSELKRVKLINGKMKGSNIYYSLNLKTWQKVKDFVLTEIDLPKED